MNHSSKHCAISICKGKKQKTAQMDNGLTCWIND